MTLCSCAAYSSSYCFKINVELDLVIIIVPLPLLFRGLLGNVGCVLRAAPLARLRAAPLARLPAARLRPLTRAPRLREAVLVARELGGVVANELCGAGWC